MTGGVKLVPESQRVSRVGEAMKAEIADILRKKVKDPRIGFATITGITVTRDFRHAFVQITVLEGQTTEKDTLLGLQKASGFIRSELGRRLRLRRIPDLTFQCDNHIGKNPTRADTTRSTRHAQGGNRLISTLRPDGREHAKVVIIYCCISVMD